MCGSPLGYGSISSTYEFSPAASGSLATSHVCSRAHTACHFGSISLGSYRRSVIAICRLLPRSGRRSSGRAGPGCGAPAGPVFAGLQGVALYHQTVAEKESSPSTSAVAAADRVASIVAAAEAAAERMRSEAEERMRARIAEGDRAADNRVKAAEEEAEEIVRLAQAEATRLRDTARAVDEGAQTTATTEALTIVGRAQEEAEKSVREANATATRVREEAEERARGLLSDARDTAGGVRAEGLEIVANLRQMGDSLRSNAERLLRDVQLLHSRMVAEIDRVDGGLSAGGRRGPARDQAASAAPARSVGELPEGSDDLDVPEFIPPG